MDRRWRQEPWKHRAKLLTGRLGRRTATMGLCCTALQRAKEMQKNPRAKQVWQQDKEHVRRVTVITQGIHLQTVTSFAFIWAARLEGQRCRLTRADQLQRSRKTAASHSTWSARRHYAKLWPRVGWVRMRPQHNHLEIMTKANLGNSQMWNEAT